MMYLLNLHYFLAIFKNKLFICLSVIYLTTLSVAEAIRHTIRLLVNSDLGKVWKKIAVA
jgi:hypothetical protein